MSDLVGVSDRHGVVVPVLVFALGLGSATLLGLVLHSNGKPLVEVKHLEGDTRVVLVDGADYPVGADDVVYPATLCPVVFVKMLPHC